MYVYVILKDFSFPIPTFFSFIANYGFLLLYPNEIVDRNVLCGTMAWYEALRHYCIHQGQGVLRGAQVTIVYTRGRVCCQAPRSLLHTPGAGCATRRPGHYCIHQAQGVLRGATRFWLLAALQFWQNYAGPVDSPAVLAVLSGACW